MKVGLLDVNILLALLDPDHLHHERVDEWAADGLTGGWATCAVTQNGFVRVLSQPRYPGNVSVATAVNLLQMATTDNRHVFWSCELPFTDNMIRADRILGARQITDVYLLAVAVRENGVLVTLDSRIDISLVEGATPEHLITL